MLTTPPKRLCFVGARVISTMFQSDVEITVKCAARATMPSEEGEWCCRVLAIHVNAAAACESRKRLVPGDGLDSRATTGAGLRPAQTLTTFVYLASCANPKVLYLFALRSPCRQESYDCVPVTGPSLPQSSPTRFVWKLELRCTSQDAGVNKKFPLLVWFGSVRFGSVDFCGRLCQGLNEWATVALL